MKLYIVFTILVFSFECTKVKAQVLTFQDETTMDKIVIENINDSLHINTIIINKSLSSIFIPINSYSEWEGDSVLLIVMGWDQKNIEPIRKIKFQEIKSQDSLSLNYSLVKHNCKSVSLRIESNYLKKKGLTDEQLNSVLSGNFDTMGYLLLMLWNENTIGSLLLKK